MKEGTLLKLLKNPSSKCKGFKLLVDLYQEKLYWVIRKMVLSHDTANDVLQETYIRIFKGIDNFKGNSAISTWMYRIAYNECLRFLSKERAHKVLNGESHIEFALEQQHIWKEQCRTWKEKGQPTDYLMNDVPIPSNSPVLQGLGISSGIVRGRAVVLKEIGGGWRCKGLCSKEWWGNVRDRERGGVRGDVVIRRSRMSRRYCFVQSFSFSQSPDIPIRIPP